jgi:tetratricopeptide (TPR) repeat protein
MGDVEDAAGTLSNAIAIDPAAEPAYRSLAQIVLQSSSAPDAAIVTQLCSWNATVCNALKLRVARESGDSALQAAAISGLERAPQSDVIGHCELARAREWTGRIPDARTEMERCVAADPSPQNYYRLGLIYQRLGLAESARKQMEVRQQLLAKMSEQTANGLSALKALQ